MFIDFSAIAFEVSKMVDALTNLKKNSNIFCMFTKNLSTFKFGHTHHNIHY